MEGNVFSIVWKTFQARLSATIYKFTRKFWEENTLLKTFFSFIFFGPWLKHSRVLSDKIQSGYQYAFYVSLKEFGREQKETLKENFSNLEEKSPPVLSKFQFTCSWEQFERKNFLKQFQFSKIFVYWAEKSSAFVKSDLAEWWKLHSTGPLEKHGDKDLGWFFFRTLNKNSSVWCQKLWAGVVKTASYASIGSF